MSGILQEQAQQVIDAYQDDFILSPPLQQQEWLLIHGKKKAAC
jgi:ribosomal protein L11 methylase PrmA